MSKASRKINKKLEARRLYVTVRQALPVIALNLNVSERTISRWKSEGRRDGDDWDVARSASTLASDGMNMLTMQLIEDYVIQHQAAIEALKEQGNISAIDRAKTLASLSDSFIKTMNAAGRLSPELSKLSTAMEVVRLLGDFVREYFPEHGSVLVEILGPFGEKLAQVYQ